MCSVPFASKCPGWRMVGRISAAAITWRWALVFWRRFSWESAVPRASEPKIRHVTSPGRRLVPSLHSSFPRSCDDFRFSLPSDFKLRGKIRGDCGMINEEDSAPWSSCAGPSGFFRRNLLTLPVCDWPRGTKAGCWPRLDWSPGAWFAPWHRRRRGGRRIVHDRCRQ